MVSFRRKMFRLLKQNKLKQDMCAISDPLGQTHSPAGSENYFHLKFVLLCEFLKSGDGRTEGRKDGRTNTMCENSGHSHPCL